MSQQKLLVKEQIGHEVKRASAEWALWRAVAVPEAQVWMDTLCVKEPGTTLLWQTAVSAVLTEVGWHIWHSKSSKNTGSLFSSKWEPYEECVWKDETRNGTKNMEPLKIKLSQPKPADWTQVCFTTTFAYYFNLLWNILLSKMILYHKVVRIWCFN